MEFRIVKLSELSEPQARRTFELFAEGFYNIFSPISKNKAKLAQLFMDSFDRQMAHVCLYGDQAVGMLACGNAKKQPIRLRRKTCLRVLGRPKGILVYRLANPMLSRPKVKGDREGYLDYLTTDPAFRGKGIGSRLMRHACETWPYDRFSFEVLEKNENAIRLYKKLGFRPVKVKNDPFAMLAGGGRPIIMALEPGRKLSPAV